MGEKQRKIEKLLLLDFPLVKSESELINQQEREKDKDRNKNENTQAVPTIQTVQRRVVQGQKERRKGNKTNKSHTYTGQCKTAHPKSLPIYANDRMM